MKLLAILLIGVVLISGCTGSSYQPVTEITIEGHGNQVYTFSNDIRQSLRVPVNDPDGIKEIGRDYDIMAMVFNSSSPQDNAYFTVVTTNMMNKIPNYDAYEGRVFQLIPFYFDEKGQWYNRTGGNITKPDFRVPAIWLVGPNTGANETSLRLTNNTIYVSGTDYKNLTMAADKLTLLFFNIDKID